MGKRGNSKVEGREVFAVSKNSSCKWTQNPRERTNCFSPMPLPQTTSAHFSTCSKSSACATPAHSLCQANHEASRKEGKFGQGPQVIPTISAASYFPEVCTGFPTTQLLTSQQATRERLRCAILTIIARGMFHMMVHSAIQQLKTMAFSSLPTFN